MVLSFLAKDEINVIRSIDARTLPILVLSFF